MSRRLNQATPRLQRILHQDISIQLQHALPTRLKEPASRLLVQSRGTARFYQATQTECIYQITSQLNAKSDSLQQLHEASQADDTLAILKYTIQKGWSSSIKELPSEIQAFWTFQEELTTEDGLILKGTGIVVPSMKQAEILKLIHEGHLGLTKCKLRAKETVYWPGLNDQLKKLVLNCQLYLK